MINEGITRGIMIDFNALRKSFPTKDTYIASLLDQSSSLDALRMTPRITPAMTPKKVAIVKAFVLKNEAQPFLDGFKLYARFRKPDFMLFSSMVSSAKNKNILPNQI